MKSIKKIGETKTIITREKVAKAIKEVNSEKKRYSKEDMIAFAEYILLVNTGNSGENIEQEFKIWLKDKLMATEKNKTWIVSDLIDHLHNHFDLYFIYGQDNCDYDNKTDEIKFPLKCYGEYTNQFIEEMKEYLTEEGKHRLLNNSGHTNDFIIKEITEDNLILTFKNG